MKAGTTLIFALALTLGLGVATVASATDGHQLIGIGAIQKGTAGAGVASAKDATWMLLNPAGITGLERRADLSFEVFAPYRSIQPSGPALPDLGGNPLANGSAGRLEDESVFFIPSVGVVLPQKTGTLGLGFYASGGMGVDYGAPRTTIPLATGESYDHRTEYAVAKLSAAYAVPLDETFSIGASLNADISRFRSDMLTGAFSQTRGAWDWDTAFGAGFQVGVVKRFGRLSVGGTYISRQWMERFDKYADLLSSSLDLPQTIQVGLAYALLPELELLLDYKFLDWSSIAQIGDAPSEGGFGWDDQHVVKIAGTWTVNDALALRAGFSHAESPIDDDVVFANALFPAIVEDHVTAGASYRPTPRDTLHVAFMHAFENELTDSGTGDLYSMAGAGTIISLEENSYTVQYTRSF